jgi:hypothetical protein
MLKWRRVHGLKADIKLTPSAEKSRLSRLKLGVFAYGNHHNLRISLSIVVNA